MGLDSVVVKVEKSAVIDDFSFIENPTSASGRGSKATEVTERDAVSSEGIKSEIFYWRNNREIQHHMQTIYINKNGCDMFNHEYVRLEEDDLDDLDHAATCGKINFDKNRMDHYRDFITNARKALEDGFALYYYSSW